MYDSLIFYVHLKIAVLLVVPRIQVSFAYAYVLPFGMTMTLLKYFLNVLNRFIQAHFSIYARFMSFSLYYSVKIHSLVQVTYK